ncbi:hypothetical protein NQ317_017156 [Molorchus minor]|uniref:CBM21 domain-containing protein n=1 Tax=Molorchus minor TaxID=1323400 RepID=A0ABQ9JJ51_9CUCU|nr:hypothetical protein NQ317_017156 [Molorchus minor]
MTAEREKCGLNYFIPMSCRGKAEAFARRLHSRLRTLNSQEENGSPDESSWLAGHDSIAVSQPRHTENDFYLGSGLLESPGSPEESEEPEPHRLINGGDINNYQSNVNYCPKTKDKFYKTSSNDSDSDGSFYDTENDIDQRPNHLNGEGNSESSRSHDSETGIHSNSQETSNQEESFATTSEGTPQPSSSLTDDLSTLSLSLEINDPFNVNGNPECETYTTCNGDIKIDNDEQPMQNGKVNSINQTEDITEDCLRDAEENNEIGKTEFLIKPKEDDDDEEEISIPRIRRCSSLKTGKTPPDTPGRKKIVRFADVLGLDLADVRTYLDEIPKIPNSAYEDLKGIDLSEASPNICQINSVNAAHGVKVDRILMPLFQQPGAIPTFLDIVRDNQVCLENAYVDDPIMLSIKGIVRVRNLDFHKSVYIRYTLDSWKTFADVQAVYVKNSCDGFSDKFSFLIYAHTSSIGQRLEFACRFQCKGCQYWDNNKGANYCFQCLPATQNSTVAPITGIDDLRASFY